jgi:plastocyanin domain-containing protein
MLRFDRLFVTSLSLALATGALACEQTSAANAAPAANESTPEAPQRVQVEVTAKGYAPASVRGTAGKPLTLVFRRTSEQGCGQHIVFPEQGIKKELPLNRDVEVTVAPNADKPLAFTCGMGMYKGSVVVD